MEQRRLVEISSQQYDFRTLIIFSKYPLFIRRFRSFFYTFLNQILDALTVDSKRLQHVRTKWIQDIALARNQFTVRAQPRRRHVHGEAPFFLPASCSFVHDWHLCGLITMHVRYWKASNRAQLTAM
jgi:hypothetical protein